MKKKHDSTINKIISKYLREYFESAKQLDGADDYKKQQVIDQFNEMAGIVGGAIIFANNAQQTAEIFPDKTLIKWRLSRKDKQPVDLIHAILYATTHDKDFKSRNLLKYPKFFLNFPPDDWACSFPRATLERNIISDRSVDYHVCLVEEVLFFNYAWRYLIRCACGLGLDALLDASALPDDAIRLKDRIDTTDPVFWAKYPDLPEHDLICKIQDLTLLDGWQGIDTVFKKQINASDLVYHDMLFDVSREYANLGLTTPLIEFEAQRLALINVRQLLKYSCELFKRKDIDAGLRNEVMYLNNALKAIDKVTNTEGDEKKPELLKFYKNEYQTMLQGIHCNFKTCLVELLCKSIATQKMPETYGVLEHNCGPTIGNILSTLHARSRYPILLSYYLTYLNGKTVVHDYFVFPVLRSSVYTVDSTDFRSEDVGEYQIDRVVLMMAFIDPIWTNKAFLPYVLKDETPKTFEGFKLNQLFYSKAARQIIDEKFYGNYFKEQEWRKNFFKLAHSQVQYFQALEVFVGKAQISETDKRQILHYVEMLQGLLEVAKYFSNPSEYIDKFDSPQPVDLKQELLSVLSTLEIILSEESMISHGFKASKTFSSALHQAFKEDSLFRGNYRVMDSIFTNSYINPIRLLLKDVIINAIENSDKGKPLVTIDVHNELPFFTTVRVTNNSIPASDKILRSFSDPSVYEGNYGLQIIKALVSALGWTMYCPDDYLAVQRAGSFYLEFKIPKL